MIKKYLKSFAVACVILAMGFFIMIPPASATDFRVWPGVVEKPPAEYSSGPYTAQTLFLPEFDGVNAYCNLHLGPLPMHGYYLGCYIPDEDLIVAPTQTGDVVRWAVLLHEEAHARGWRHLISWRYE